MGVFSTSICLFLPILAPRAAQASQPMGLAELFWAGGWSDHPSPLLHSKIFEKSKIDVQTGTFILGNYVNQTQGGRNWVGRVGICLPIFWGKELVKIEILSIYLRGFLIFGHGQYLEVAQYHLLFFRKYQRFLAGAAV